MQYVLSKGLIHPLTQRFEYFGGIVMPAAAAVFLIVALFSSSSFTAQGKHPHIKQPKSAQRSAAAAGRSAVAAGSSAGVASGSASAPSGSASPSVDMTQSLSGGRGGGSLSGITAASSPTATSPTAGSSSPTSSTPTSSGGGSTSGTGGLLPATVTIPSLNESIGGKTLFSTSGTSVTAN